MTEVHIGAAKNGESGLPFIFIVDDERPVAEVVETILNLERYRTRLFVSPYEALEAFQAASPKPDLLLSDFAMAGMNGMELIKRCKTIQPTLKTILYSGTVDSQIFESELVKPDRFLAKPFLPRVLVEMIRETLRESRDS